MATAVYQNFNTAYAAGLLVYTAKAKRQTDNTNSKQILYLHTDSYCYHALSVSTCSRYLNMCKPAMLLTVIGLIMRELLLLTFAVCKSDIFHQAANSMFTSF